MYTHSCGELVGYTPLELNNWLLILHCVRVGSIVDIT